MYNYNGNQKMKDIPDIIEWTVTYANTAYDLGYLMGKRYTELKIAKSLDLDELNLI